MDVITDTVTVGNIVDARTEDMSVFDCVITTCQTNISDDVEMDETVYIHHELADGKQDEIRGGECTYELFERAADDLRAAVLNEQKTLIHCHAGVSRSVSVTAAVLSVVDDKPVSDSIVQIQECRPEANPIDRLRDYARLYASIYTDCQVVEGIPENHRPPEFTQINMEE